METGDKNRHDFHCMQMSLVMSMRFIFGDDWNEEPCSIVPVREVKRNLQGTVLDICYPSFSVL